MITKFRGSKIKSKKTADRSSETFRVSYVFLVFVGMFTIKSFRISFKLPTEILGGRKREDYGTESNLPHVEISPMQCAFSENLEIFG